MNYGNLTIDDIDFNNYRVEHFTGIHLNQHPADGYPKSKCLGRGV